MFRSNFIWMLVFIASSVSAQSEWEVFPVLTKVNEIEFHSNKAYAVTNVGLLIIDLETMEERFLVDNDLGRQAISEIEFLSNGNYWLSAYEKGLFYYDGNALSSFNDSNLNPQVGTLKMNGDTLWFKESGFLHSIHDGEITKHDNLPEITINGYGFDKENNLWIGNLSETLKINQNTIVEKILFPKYEWGGVNTYFIDYLGQHWVTASDEIATGPGILEWRNYLSRYDEDSETWREFTYPGSHVSQSDSCIHYNFNNSFYVIANNVLTRLALDDFNLDLSSISDNFTLLAKEDSETLWIAPDDDPLGFQLYRIKKDSLWGFGKNTILSSPSVDIALDCKDNLISSGSNLQKYINESWMTSEIDYVNPNCQIDKVVSDTINCVEWAISNNEDCYSVWQIKDGDYREFDVLPEDECTSITLDTKGNFYLACSDELIKINTQGIASTIDPLGYSGVNHVYYSKNGTLWVASRRTLLSYYNDNWTEYSTNNIINIRKIYEDPFSFMWFISNKAYKYNGQEWINYAENFIDESIKIYDMKMDEKGNVWFATSQGIFYKEGQKILNFSTSNSDILSQNCLQLELQNDSILWIRHGNGISKMIIDGPISAIKEMQTLDTNPAQFSLYPNPTHSGFTLSFPHIEDRKSKSSTCLDNGFTQQKLQIKV